MPKKKKRKRKKKTNISAVVFSSTPSRKILSGGGGFVGGVAVCPSAYLDSTTKSPMGRTLMKLRIGCHNIGVVAGRYVKTPLDERICPLGSGNKMEEETHL